MFGLGGQPSCGEFKVDAEEAGFEISEIGRADLESFNSNDGGTEGDQGSDGARV
ncbi:hypothetical protein CCACVL1_06697 [Corchorus capsularis]|uniref:Uncharacterized protein n=1 Tax=Corchorus capsularis TaxID=210143 RepID=A0A1R3JDU3_COCAP|nr:hypothetical protein CCACVL1_06697 [Corchorus capsularis]